MTRVAVEAAFGSSLADVLATGGTWTDITQYVDIITSGISVTRGAEDELSQIQAGTCTLALDDSDGRFTPENASSPYFPNVVDGVPLRVSVATVNTNFVRNPSFEGGSVETWEWSPGVEVTTVATPAVVGSSAARVRWSPSSGDSFQTQVYGLTIGAVYTASAWVWVPAGDAPVNLAVTGVTNGLQNSVFDGWQRLTVTWTATAAVHQLRLKVSATPAAGDLVYVDAVEVEQGATAVPINLLANSDFESGVGDWFPSGSAVAVQSTTRAFTGTASMQATWSGAAGEGVDSATIPNLTVGAVYTFSAWVWVPAGDAPVNLAVAGVTNGVQNSVFDGWQRLTVTWTATATSHQVRLKATATPAAGDMVWMDGAKVEAGSTPTAYSALDGAQLHPRFFGLVNQWPVTWAGLAAKTSITATDVFAVLSRAEEQMRPMLVQESLVWGPNALYPLDEASGATTSGNEATGTGPQALAIGQSGVGGTLEFGAGTAPLGMSGAPLFTPASSTAGKYLRAELGGGFEYTSAVEPLLVEAWFSTTTPGRNILTVASRDKDYYLIIYLGLSTGYLTVQTKQPDVAASTVTAGTVSLADGALHHVIYDAAAQELFVDGVSIGSFGGILPVKDLTTLTVGASHNGLTLWEGSISSVALYLDSSMSAADLVNHYECGTTGFAGETADERGFRLAAYAGIGFSDTGIFTTGIAEQAALGRTGLDHLRDVEATESGKLMAHRDTPAVTLQARSVRYNPTSALTIVYADLEPDQFELAYDTQKVVNTLLLTRPGGATQRLVHTASKQVRGPIGRSVDTLCTSDLVVADLGNWLLQRYNSPAVELRGVRVNAYTMGRAVYRTLLDADISTVLTVTALPAQAPVPSMPVTIEGYTETIRHNSHELAFHTSRAVTDSVWLLDDPVYSVLDSTTRLAY